MLVKRDTTERPEALTVSTIKLVGTIYDKIVSEVSALIEDSKYYNTMSQTVNSYSDGKVWERIIKQLEKK